MRLVTFVTGFAFWRNTGSPSLRIGKMAIGPPLSTGPLSDTLRSAQQRVLRALTHNLTSLGVFKEARLRADRPSRSHRQAALGRPPLPAPDSPVDLVASPSTG